MASDRATELIKTIALQMNCGWGDDRLEPLANLIDEKMLAFDEDRIIGLKWERLAAVGRLCQSLVGCRQHDHITTGYARQIWEAIFPESIGRD
jgi:hypothetical protein